MTDSFRTDGVGNVPAGYAAIPISGDQVASPLKICAVIKVEPDPLAGHLVVLRDTVDAQVLLGCVRDSGGCVHRWIELWIQDLGQLTGAPITCREALSNALLDERWGNYFEALRGIHRGSVVETGWERAHPPPTLLDLERLEPFHPTDEETGQPWRLCQDDSALERKGLPHYSTSLHRYLHLPGLEGDSPFVAVTEDAPSCESTRSLSQLTGGEKNLPLNVGGGLILVREFSPVGLEAFMDVLIGKPWDGLYHGRTEIQLAETEQLMPGPASNEAQSEGRLFLGRHGKWGRFVESFHLKLALLDGMAGAVRGFVRRAQKPLLNLRPESFQLGLGETNARLPFLWAARAVLADPGDAVELPIESTEESCYLIGRRAGASIYRPESAQEPIRSSGMLRIRRLLEEGGRLTVVEGTLSTQESFKASPSDLLWLRLNLGGTRINLYARLETEASMAAGEWRFRSIGQQLEESLVTALREAEGVPIRDTTFEFLPSLGVPCDLYSLGVLAVRSLLVNSRKTLPIALDEILTLARKVADRYSEEESLERRIAAVFAENEEWRELLGPQFLTDEEISPEEAFDLITLDLWWGTLAMLVRMFPAMGSDSTCGDFGSAQKGAMHKVFDQVLADLNRLLLNTRSLIVIDWRFNREIHSVIRSQLAGNVS